MNSRVRFVAALLLVGGVLAGCSSNSTPEYGDKKEDWNKSEPPAGWKGPGQPDAPKTGPIGGPPEGK